MGESGAKEEVMRDLKGQTIVLTGGSNGIGAAAARILAKEGAKLVITGRSEETMKIASETGADHFLVDFAKLSDVRRLAEELLAKYPRIDVLVNNVGGIFSERKLTADGHEMTLQVNHLGGFLLTNLLRERLEQSKARVINTSSAANLMAKIDLTDLENQRDYSDFRSYGRAKQMNILHAMEINKRFSGVSAVSFHPGPVRTGFAREGKGIVSWIYESPLKHVFLISPEKGADTLVWLARGEPGKDWKPGELYAKRKPFRKNSQVSTELARELWEASLKATESPAVYPQANAQSIPT